MPIGLTEAGRGGSKWGIVGRALCVLQQPLSVKPSAPSLLFSGEVRHTLDPKNRVTIPARWRSDEVDEFFIVPHSKQACLVAMPLESFERVGEEAAARAPSPAAHRTFLTQFYSRATRCVVDKQGRLLLPEELCKTVDLRGELMLAGSLDRFEIWNPANWAAFRDAVKATYEQVADLVGL